MIRAIYATCGQQRPHVALWAFAYEFLIWWHQAGEVFYGKRAGFGGTSPSGCTYQYDEGLRGMAVEAVTVLGGWRIARALIKAQDRIAEAAQQDRPRPGRGIHLRA